METKNLRGRLLLLAGEQSDQRVIAEEMILVGIGLLVQLDGERGVASHLVNHLDALASRASAYH